MHHKKAKFIMILSVQIAKHPSLLDLVKRLQSATSSGSSLNGAHVRQNVAKAFKIVGSSVRNLTVPQSHPVQTSQVARLTRNLTTPRNAKVKQSNAPVNGSPVHFRIVTRSVEVALALVKFSASLMVLP